MKLLSTTVQAEIKRRRRFLAAVLRGEKPKGETKSYLRLSLITINQDGSYAITDKGRSFIEPDYFEEPNDSRPEETHANERRFPFDPKAD